jgi:hypothetical protein
MKAPVSAPGPREPRLVPCPGQGQYISQPAPSNKHTGLRAAKLLFTWQL